MSFLLYSGAGAYGLINQANTPGRLKPADPLMESQLIPRSLIRNFLQADASLRLPVYVMLYVIITGLV